MAHYIHLFKMIQPALKSIYEKKKVIKTKVHSQLFRISRKKKAAHITFPDALVFPVKLCAEREIQVAVKITSKYIH